MICPTCRGRGFIPAGVERDDDLVEMKPCPECTGGIASCCDAAGSRYNKNVISRPIGSFTCPRCGATSFNPNDIRERYCGRCRQWADGPQFFCAGCGAVQQHRMIMCEQCGKPLVFPRMSNRYRDDTFPERLCDGCGQLYRGPAVYCSLECAVDDA